MYIVVGSQNQVKVDAVKELIPLYPLWKGAEVISFDANSGVEEQPRSFYQTFSGAKNRAFESFCHKKSRNTFAIGIEGGLTEVPMGKTCIVNFCVVCVYDGLNFAFGISSGFEYPKSIVNLIHSKNMDLDEVLFELKLTENERIGASEGAVGLLTHGRVNRKDYIKQAIIMAMIQFENPKLYGC